MRWPALALLLVACGGSAAPATTTTTGIPTTATATTTSATASAPELLGRPVWDGALSDPMALRALDRVRAALADSPPVLEGTDPRMWLGPVQTWVERRAKLIRELQADAQAMAGDPDAHMQLLGMLVYSVASDDFVTDLLALEPPAEVTSGEFGADITAAFKEAIERQAAPVAKNTRVTLGKCLTLAPASPASLRGWESFCRDRDIALGALEARVAARGAVPTAKPVPQPPALFADCKTTEERPPAPVAPPPDMKAKPVVAYVYDGTELKGDDARTLEQSVAAKLGSTSGMAVVSAKELSAARTLVAQKKLHARAPVCGQPPPLPAVLAHTHHHLVLAEITTTCIYVAGGKEPGHERCGLKVHYWRPGSDDGEGLPGSMFAPVDSRHAPAASWIAAASQLAPDDTMVDLIGSLDGDSSPVLFDFANYSDEDPWLRVADMLEDETQKRLATCVDAGASFDASFTVSKTGNTTGVTLQPLAAPPADSKVAACVKKALEATPWPCPSSGKPAKVSVRMCVAPRPAQ